MSMICQFQTEGKPACSRHTLPGKDFCGPHSLVAASLEELVETNALGPGTAAEIAEQLAVAQAPAAKKPRARSAEAPTVDPETMGGRMAEKLVAMEAAARSQRALARQRTQKRREDGTVLPEQPGEGQPTFTVRPRRARADATRMVGPDGKSLVKPGWVPRWVRNTDALNRPSDARIEDFKDFGYEPVIDPTTNKPLTSIYGIAMQAPSQQYALRVMEHSPPGALNPDELYDDTRIAIEEANSEAGEEIARWVEDPSHKSGRKWHGPAAEAVA